MAGMVKVRVGALAGSEVRLDPEDIRSITGTATRCDVTLKGGRLLSVPVSPAEMSAAVQAALAELKPPGE